jgi:hypothetical protein
MLEVHNKESFGLSRLYTFLNEQVIGLAELKSGSKSDHFRKAYLWDISSSSFPVHHKLIQEHIHVFLTSDNKMRKY